MLFRSHSVNMQTQPSTPSEVNLVTVFESVGGGIILGNESLAVTKAFCRVEQAPEGWTLLRHGNDPLGRFFAEGCTLEDAVSLIAHGTVSRETEVLSNRAQTKRILSSAIADAFRSEEHTSELQSH